MKLFETVLGIYEKGAAELTSSERSFIESETRAMLQAAASKKKAEMAPEGFEQFLDLLRTAENADEAYSMVVDFMKSKGDLGNKGPMDMGMGKDPLMDMGKGPMDMGLGKNPLMDMGKGPMDMGKDPLMDMGKGPMDMGKDPLMDLEKDVQKGLGGEPPKEDFGMGMGKGKGDGSGPMKDKHEMHEKSESPFEEKKEEESGEDESSMKDNAPKHDDKDKDKDGPPHKKDDKDSDKDDKDSDKDNLKELKARVLKRAGEMEKEDKKEEKEEKDECKEECKEEKEEDKKASLASKVRVKITPRRDICAYYNGKPAFYAITRSEVKEDLEALKRTANKVYGWIVYEGLKMAAAKCGSRLMAGVDDGIETVVDVDVPAASAPITDDAVDNIKDGMESPENDSRDKAEFVTKETPDKVEAGVDDNVEVVTAEKPDATPSSVTSDADDVVSEKVENPDSDVRDDADVDYKSAEANFQKLYASRAKKMAKEAQAKFVSKFVRAMKLAARRMELNYDHNPYKAASFDVLVNETGMEPDFASDLVESISHDGHAPFVNQLLERTSSLMKKSDEYLDDMETDLSELKVKPVDVPRSAKKASTKSETLRKEASEGNFAVRNPGTRVVAGPVSNDNNLIGGIKSAVGDTLLSRRASRIKGQ